MPEITDADTPDCTPYIFVYLHLHLFSFSVSFSLQSHFVRVSVTQMPQISHKWRKYAWQNNTNIVAIAAPMLPRQCHSRCQHEYESNGPRSRRAFEVLICQANGPNVVNVRAKIKRPSAIGSKIVTGTSSPLQIEGWRKGGRDRLRLIAVFALVD